MDISAIQIIIVLVIALLVFGPARLPGFARQVGRGLREMRQQMSSLSEDVKEAIDRDEIESAPSRANGSSDPATGAPAAAAAATGGAEGAAGSTDDELLDGVVVRGDSGPRETG